MPGGTAPYFSTVAQDAVDGGKAGENFPPQLVHASPVSIPLTRGFAALVDSADYEAIAAFKWQAEVKHGKVYARRNEWIGDGKFRSHFMHRAIAGAAAGQVVDHINGDGLDNRRANIRVCDRFGNARNSAKKKISRHTYKGVKAVGARFGARIYTLGRYYWLGTFPTEIEAARVYDDAARRLHGAFARLNFPNEDKVLAAHGLNIGSESAAWAGEKITP
jgi:hypothetical protein